MLMERVSSPVHTERFELEQFVRVQLGNNRVEIGVVTATDDLNNTVTVATRHGYDVTISASAVKRAFLIVLDLNGVLVARGKGSFTHRPYVEEFIKFVFKNFAVAVWTSGLERSSNPIIESVFGVYRDRLLFTLYRDACISRPTVDNPYGTVKNLQRIFDTYPKSFHSVNTIIIDDSPGKCSHPDIALCPVPFNDPTRQKNDTGLLQAMSVLEEVLKLNSHLPLIRAAEERLCMLSEERECCESKMAMAFEVNCAQDTAHPKSNDIAISSDTSRTKESAPIYISSKSENHNNTHKTVNKHYTTSSSSDSNSRVTNVNDNNNPLGDDKLNNKSNELEMMYNLTLNEVRESNSNCAEVYQNDRAKESKNDDIKSNTEHSISLSSEYNNRESKNNAETVMFNEVNLWNTRLCCEFIRGCCRYGDKCRYRHDRDDGKQPCYRKNHCRFGHAARWVVTDGDRILERQREHYKQGKPPNEKTKKTFSQLTESSNADNAGESVTTASAPTNNSTNTAYDNNNKQLSVENTNVHSNNDNSVRLTHDKRGNTFDPHSVDSKITDIRNCSQTNNFSMKPELGNLHYNNTSTTVLNVPRDTRQIDSRQQLIHNPNLQSVWSQTLTSPHSIQSVNAEEQCNSASILSRFIQSSQSKHRHYNNINNNSKIENIYSDKRTEYEKNEKESIPFTLSTALEREVQERGQLHLTSDKSNGKLIIQQLATNLAKTNVTRCKTNMPTETKERQNTQYESNINTSENNKENKSLSYRNIKNTLYTSANKK